MNESKQKILLYCDGSYQAFSAAIYTAKFLQDHSNTHLTILQVQDMDLGSQGLKYNWIELRLKYRKSYLTSVDPACWADMWPVSPNSKWLNHIFVVSDPTIRQTQYAEILTKTNYIFSQKQRVQRQKLYLNVNLSEQSNRSDKIVTIIDYATKNMYDLIIIGTRGFSAFQRIIFGSLSYELLSESPIPIILIKKLSQNFIKGYLSNLAL